jgi:hypothetical protein
MLHSTPASDALAYRVEDFARVSGLGRTKIYEVIKNRKLRARKFGKRTIILDSDGREFLNSLPDLQPA